MLVTLLLLYLIIKSYKVLNAKILIRRDRIAYKENLERMSSLNGTMTVPQFYRLRRSMRNTQSDIYNFSGVYILKNTNTGRTYVGQSVRVHNRVHNHFRGKGSPGVYQDYRRGHEFTIQTVALHKTNFLTINDLERHYIGLYYHNTYNKTKGNRTYAYM